MGRRRSARECALQMLFQAELARAPADRIFRQFWTDQELGTEVRRFAERLVRGTLARLAELDRIVSASAANWRVERMAVVDRNVLRMAVYEMLWERETPAVVVIDEAIEVAKKYGSEDSGAFINGILDDVRRRLERGEFVQPSAG